MAKTHWKKLQNPDYLGAYALEPGKDLVATIKSASEERVIGPDGKKDDCLVVHFQERTIKPMIINTTNAKMIAKLVDSPFIEDWPGVKIQIYVAKVKAFGEVVEALRIRPTAPRIQGVETLKCADCGGEITRIDEKRDAKYMANLTTQKYGKPLCATCATKHKAAQDAEKQTAADILDAPEESNAQKEEGDPFDDFKNE